MLDGEDVWAAPRFESLRNDLLNWLLDYDENEGLVGVLQIPVIGQVSSFEDLPDMPALHCGAVLAAALGMLLALYSEVSPPLRLAEE